MGEIDPIEELSTVRTHHLGIAESHMSRLPDDLKTAWRSVTTGMLQLDIEANGVASRLQRMADPEYVGLVDSEGRVQDRRKVMHEAAEHGAAVVANNPVPVRLDVLTALLQTAAVPKVPDDPVRQSLLRDDLKVKLSSVPADQVAFALREIGVGQNRELAAVLNSGWGKDYVKSLGHREPEIEQIVQAATVEGSALHGTGREKAAALALANGLPAARKAYLAGFHKAKSVIDRVRPGQVVGTWSGGH